MLAPAFAGHPPDITEENIQSRARGVTLMALSNKFGWMVLSTGNKSRDVGRLCHALWRHVRRLRRAEGCLQDEVFALSRWRNQAARRVSRAGRPRHAGTRHHQAAVSAELKPDQTDQDTLPPYDVLDDILECLVEHEMPVDDRRARPRPRRPCARVWRMLDRAEYKRRQAPPGVKITRRAFGRDRRYPITNAFQDSGPVPVEDAGETPRAPAPSIP